MVKSLWLIYNPRSGRRRGAWAAGYVATRAHLDGWETVLRPTERPRHAAELVREAVAAGAARIGLIGGDGTVHEAVAGLEGAAVPLALLPAGTGNDLARTLGVPRKLDAAIEVLLHGRERAIDLWRWNGVPFVNVAGVGLDAAVADAVNRRLRRLRGKLAYLAGVAITLPGVRPVRVKLAGDDWQHEGAAMLVAVANGQFYGSGMRIAPAAVPDDGLLDVVVVGDVSKGELIRQLPRVFAGTHTQHPQVRCFRTRTLHVEVVGGDAPVTLDGELAGGLPARVDPAPAPVRFLVRRER
jgi:diacylglycerol kinase (ATP)